MNTTWNELVGKIAERAGKLANEKIDVLRASHPDVTETESQLIRHVKEMGLSRGDIISAILLEEFSREFDIEIMV